VVLLSSIAAAQDRSRDPGRNRALVVAPIAATATAAARVPQRFLTVEMAMRVGMIEGENLGEMLIRALSRETRKMLNLARPQLSLRRGHRIEVGETGIERAIARLHLLVILIVAVVQALTRGTRLGSVAAILARRKQTVRILRLRLPTRQISRSCQLERAITVRSRST
jgi:hypothetical protein